jgi:2-methylcitrate dehydratase PrpD
MERRGAETAPAQARSDVSGLTGFVLDWPVSRFPATARRKAAEHLLDTLGVAAAAHCMEAGVIARESALALFACAGETDGARLLFDGRRVSLAGAAFAGATQIDNLDAHDGYNPTKGHIGVVAVPALAALAETRLDLTGHEALAALVVCYEVAGRAGIALHGSVSDYHTSGAWNALGVAAMAARLRGFSTDQLRQALGIAEYHGPRSQMMREIATPTMLHDGSGWGALAGLSAAVMAEKGFKGAPAITVEDPAVAPVWADLGEYWQVERQYIKPYPVCRWAHAALDAVALLRCGHSFDPSEIESLRIESFQQAVSLFSGMPGTTSEAQYSLAFAMASFLVHGRLGVAEITGDDLRDPRVAELTGRITAVEAQRFVSCFPERRLARVEILLRDGRRLDSGDLDARGGPEAPLTRDELTAKFEAYAKPALGPSRTAALREAVLGLEDEASRFSDVAALLYEAPG